MGTSITHLIFIGVAIALTALATILVFMLLSREGITTSESRADQAYDTCIAAGGQYYLRGGGRNVLVFPGDRGVGLNDNDPSGNAYEYSCDF